LEAAGFAYREDHLPIHASGGTFSAVGAPRTALNVTCD
jgi:hypothetical protein